VAFPAAIVNLSDYVFADAYQVSKIVFQPSQTGTAGKQHMNSNNPLEIQLGKNVQSIEFDGAGNATVILESGTTDISGYKFSDCNILKIHIPLSVANVAFGDSYASMSSMATTVEKAIYAGTKAQWEALTAGLPTGHPLLAAEAHYEGCQGTGGCDCNGPSYVDLNASAFSALLNDQNKTYDGYNLVFGQKSAYEVNTLTSVTSNLGEGIETYKDNDTLYILSDSIIKIENLRSIFSVGDAPDGIEIANITMNNCKASNCENAFEYTTMGYIVMVPTVIDISGLDMSDVTSTSNMFAGLTTLTTVKLPQITSGNLQNMESMFSGCYGLTTLDLSGWNTSNVTDMDQMLYGCTSLSELNISGRFVFADSHNEMLKFCDSLAKIYLTQAGRIKLEDMLMINPFTNINYCEFYIENGNGGYNLEIFKGLYVPDGPPEAAALTLRSNSIIDQYFQSEATLPAGATQQDYHIYDLTRMPTDAELEEWKSNCSARAASGYHFYGWRVNYGSGSEIIAHENLKAFLQPLFAENASLHLTMNAIDIRD